MSKATKGACTHLAGLLHHYNQGHTRMAKQNITCKWFLFFAHLAETSGTVVASKASCPNLWVYLASCSTPFTASSFKPSWALATSNSMVKEFTKAEAELSKSRSPDHVQLAGYSQSSAARLGRYMALPQRAMERSSRQSLRSQRQSVEQQLHVPVSSDGSFFASFAATLFIQKPTVMFSFTCETCLQKKRRCLTRSRVAQERK